MLCGKLFKKINTFLMRCHTVARLRLYATSQNVASLNSHEIINFFNLDNPSSRAMGLGFI
jgi:hypothetical protein